MRRNGEYEIVSLQADMRVVAKTTKMNKTSDPHTIRYDREFNVNSKAEYSALSSTRSQKKKLKQTTPVQYRLRTVKSVRKE